jgi:anti-sigma factor RsiW
MSQHMGKAADRHEAQHPPLGQDDRILLRLADELPPGEAAALEQELASDPAARARWEEWAALDIQLQMLAGTPAPADELAVRRTLRRLRQHQLQLADRPPLGSLGRPPVPRRVVLGYSAFAGAAAVVLLLGLWGVGLFDLPQTVGTRPDPVVNADEGAGLSDEAQLMKAMADLMADPSAEAMVSRGAEVDEHLRALNADMDDLSLLNM